MAKKPITITIVIPGEVTKLVEEHTFADGTKIILEKKEKVLVPSKKNNQKLGVKMINTGEKIIARPFIRQSDANDRWVASQMKIFHGAAAKMAAMGMSLPVARASIKVHFFFPDSKDRDLSNKFETIADIMVDAGIILDDRYKVLKPIHLDGWTKRDKPRTVIYLTRLEPDSDNYEWDLTSAQHEIDRKERRKAKRRINDDKKKRGVL